MSHVFGLSKWQHAPYKTIRRGRGSTCIKKDGFKSGYSGFVFFLLFSFSQIALCIHNRLYRKRERCIVCLELAPKYNKNRSETRMKNVMFVVGVNKKNSNLFPDFVNSMQLSTPFFVSPSSPQRRNDLVLALLGTLGLGGTTELLGAVLALFACDASVSCYQPR